MLFLRVVSISGFFIAFVFLYGRHWVLCLIFAIAGFIVNLLADRASKDRSQPKNNGSSIWIVTEIVDDEDN